MTFVAKSITGTIGLDNKPAIVAQREVAEESKRMASAVVRNADQASKAMGNTFHASIRNIKAEFGEGSVVSQGAKLLMGGAINVVGALFGQMGDAAAEAATALRSGDKSLGEVLGTMARGTPLLGGFIRGFDGLREAITGEKAALAAANEEAKATNAWVDGFAVRARAGAEATKTMTEAVRGLGQQLQLLKTTPGLRGGVQLDQAMGNSIADLKEKFLAQAKGPAFGFNWKDPSQIDAAWKAADEKLRRAREGLLAAQREAIPTKDVQVATGSLGQFTTMTVPDREEHDARVRRAHDAVNAATTELDKVRQLQDAYKAMNQGIQDAKDIRFYQRMDEAANAISDAWGTGLDKVRAFGAEVRAISKEQVAANKAADKSLKDSLRSPDEVFADRLLELKGLRKANRIDDKTLGRGLAEAIMDRNAAGNDGPRSGPVPGKEYAAGVNETVTAAKASDAVQKLPPLMQRLLEETVKQTGLTTKLLQTKKGKAVTTVTFP